MRKMPQKKETALLDVVQSSVSGLTGAPDWIGAEAPLATQHLKDFADVQRFGAHGLRSSFLCSRRLCRISKPTFCSSLSAPPALSMSLSKTSILV